MFLPVVFGDEGVVEVLAMIGAVEDRILFDELEEDAEGEDGTVNPDDGETSTSITGCNIL